ncbi:hypothetical protein JIN84_03345 [Luteolibacter yonseiensis]|uniref:Permuted papain-like amidase YaeF/Yiix C92 family enzyme n=1 Tax=Luteolibacter yonseiensis TaxID=1144680 RepID=A0A934R0S4_9BACT|nr:YiiX/YebB-like N1pC/P60 family cysteine hydrolase [Luteolibacter yonseiensis]MBK1814632.1 hypothetical protein [Luteolibacter yonseiensis]
MARLLPVFAILPLAVLPATAEKLREGDVVFSGAKRGQGGAIIAATGSPYTHCGIVFEKNGRLMVLEAVQPVGVIPLADFKAAGSPGPFLARRPKTPPAPGKYKEARSWAMAQIGKNYDVRFEWGDDKLYCSELVWKIYQHAGVELCEPRRFRDYDLEQPSVRKIIDERYGGMGKIPLNEKVVAPSDLANSTQLVTISTGS